MTIRVHLNEAIRLLPRPLVRTLFEEQYVSITLAVGNDASDDIVALHVSADLSPGQANALHRLLLAVGL